MASADTKIGAAAEARERESEKLASSSVVMERASARIKFYAEHKDCDRMIAAGLTGIANALENAALRESSLRSTPAEAGQPALRSSSPASEFAKTWFPDYNLAGVGWLTIYRFAEAYANHVRSAPTVSAPAPTPEAEMSGAEKEAWNRRGPNSLMFEVWRFGRHYGESSDGCDINNCNDPSHYFYEVLREK